MSAFWSGHVGPAAGCLCRVLLDSSAGMLVLLHGAAARCCLRVLLSEWCARLERACWCRCSIGMCALEQARWCPCQSGCQCCCTILLQGAGV